MREQKPVSRRRFLAAGGAALAFAGAGVGYALLSKEREPFGRLHSELEDLLDEHPHYGRIGRAYRGTSPKVILGIPHRHITNDQVAALKKLPQLTKLVSEISGTLKALPENEQLEVLKDPRYKEAIDRLAQYEEMTVGQVVYRKRLYNGMKHLADRLKATIIIGAEGAMRGSVPLSEEEMGMDLGGYLPDLSLKAALGDRAQLIGLEDEALYQEGEILIKNKQTGGEGFKRLNAKRNQKAAEYMTESLLASESKFGFLFYGAAHFDGSMYSPTIFDCLKERGMPYIEFIPAAGQEIK